MIWLANAGITPPVSDALPRGALDSCHRFISTSLIVNRGVGCLFIEGRLIISPLERFSYLTQTIAYIFSMLPGKLHSSPTADKRVYKEVLVGHARMTESPASKGSRHTGRGRRPGAIRGELNR